MAPLEFRGLDDSNWLAVCSCGHVDPYDEQQVISRRRYLEEEAADGVAVVVAHLDGQPAGFVEVVPIERAARDVHGEGALLVHCVTVFREGLGVGRALIDQASRLALTQSRDLVVDALDGVYGFMPVEFFSRLGFELVETRGTRRLMWKRVGRSTGEKLGRPSVAYLLPTYVFEPVPGAVVVDVFFTPLCTGQWSPEAAIMREAARPYGDRVVVRVYNCGDLAVRRRYGIARAVFVNGVMRPNGDVITLEEARCLLERALAEPPGGTPRWDDTISRLF